LVKEKYKQREREDEFMIENIVVARALSLEDVSPTSTVWLLLVANPAASSDAVKSRASKDSNNSLVAEGSCSDKVRSLAHTMIAASRKGMFFTMASSPAGNRIEETDTQMKFA